MDRKAWWAVVYGVAKSRTQLSNLHTYTPDKVNDTYFIFKKKPVLTFLVGPLSAIQTCIRSLLLFLLSKNIH